ncbi:uncharacterized protein LOC115879940 isoform X2 [Sitophilus oryzae]|uniref:Uncharacterized protein LOC115879940 isoform X2 n=1 Tax=Sitophilus oryzae TaxID=7048 RepID=A0A6J2XMW3_SITOR|nr:uncharacterized protein LOC115879940 isoform X2 [Sitophilus oryzae]
MATKTEDTSCYLTKVDIQQSVKTFNLSKGFAKRLLRIGVLNVMHQRLDIPHEEFIKRSYESVPYVIFRRKSNNKFIRNYHAFSAGIIDAIEKDYLKEILMYFRDNESGELLETYGFKIKYNKQSSKSNVKSTAVKKATLDFLQAIADIPGEKMESDKIELVVECTYRDEVPLEYEPPYFEVAKEPYCLDNSVNKVVNLGEVNTGFHKINCYGRGKMFNTSRQSSPISSRNNQDEIEAEIPETERVEENMAGGTKSPVSDEQPHKRPRTNSSVIDLTDVGSLDDHISLVSDGRYVTCPCLWELGSNFETVKCSKCFGEVHLVCHGYVNINDVDQTTFNCVQCDRPEDEQYVMLLMKFRIILFGIYLNKALPVFLLQLGSVEERDFVMNRLDALQVYRHNAKSILDIDYDRLNEALTQVFRLQHFSFNDSQFFQ